MSEQITTEDRYKTAVKAIRKAGVKAKVNVRKCCRSCILPSDLGFPAEMNDTTAAELPAYGYTYGSQGNAITWRDGEPFNADALRRNSRRYGYYSSTPEDSARETDVYWNHHGTAGQVIADAFREQGFEVDWDGTLMKCVIVKFPKVGA